MNGEVFRAHAPGRVNLIGDHTDYTGGFVLPMAIDRGTTITVARGGSSIELSSATEPEPAKLPLVVGDPASVKPDWARYVAGVAAEMNPTQGLTGTVETTLPIGAGLSSSAALEVATALALGFEGSTLELARLCQAAEQLASGVPCGIMDQLASAGGQEGFALLLDCRSLEITPVPLPDGVEVVVIHSGEARRLAGSAYAERRAACERAEEFIGPLREASLEAVSTLEDDLLRRRARHVISENQRVLEFVHALHDEDVKRAGVLMNESHYSLRDDFEVSTERLDQLTEELRNTPGVLGARLTGAGFGGCVVVLAEQGSPVDGWRFKPAAGASVSSA